MSTYFSTRPIRAGLRNGFFNLKMTELIERKGKNNNRTQGNASDSSVRFSSNESDAFVTRLKEVIGDESNSAFVRKCCVGDTHISEGTIRNILAGAWPRTDNLIAIANAGGVTVDWLATGKGNKYFESLKDSVIYAKNTQNQALIEEAQWIIIKEALKSIDHHWFVMLKGEPGDPIEPFASAYNAKKILPDRSGLLKEIQSVTADQVRQWGRTYFAWKDRIQSAPVQIPLNSAHLRMALTITEDLAVVQPLNAEQRADMVLSVYNRLTKGGLS